MSEKLKMFIDSGMFPFILSAGGTVKMNWTRLLETLLIACITAFITMYATQGVIENELKHINKSLSKLESKVERVELKQARQSSVLDVLKKKIK